MLSPTAIKARAHQEGFDLCGIAAADAYPELDFLGTWLARGFAGEMAYLARTAERRADVRRIVPDAKSVIVLGTLYNTDRPYSTTIDDPARAHIARYAWGDDYHDIVERRLQALLSWLRREAPGCDGRAYVDTGPVQERVYAARAGLGWIGKNTCLINHDQGSWFFLSEIIVNVALEADEPGFDRCGSCTRCLESCPTGALVEPYVLDARRCISYLTIEIKGSVPVEVRDAVGGHAFGCDICQDVCPWNRRASTSTDPAWQPRPAFEAPTVVDLFGASDDEWRAMTKGSAMKRSGVVGARRALALSLGASAAPEARDAVVATALGVRPDGSPSFDDEVVTDHVAWAIERWSAREAARDGSAPATVSPPRLRARPSDESAEQPRAGLSATVATESERSVRTQSRESPTDETPSWRRASEIRMIDE